MNLTHRPMGAIAAAAGLAVAAVAGVPSSSAAVAPSGNPGFVAVRDSLMPMGNPRVGSYRSSRMSVEVVLAPRHQSALNAELVTLYSPGSRDYRRWLAPGEFDARYAPAAATREAVASYLRAGGLTISRSLSPFLVRATGSSGQVSAVFRTTLSSYRSPRWGQYFANSASVRVPGALAPSVLGVVGLTDAVRLHTQLELPQVPPARSSPNCPQKYPTKQKLYKLGGRYLPRYAAGPYCSGLTPSQVNSIYGAPHVGARGKGTGVDLAVFEEAAYQKSDIAHWAHTFYGPRFHPPLVNIDVDGGPVHPACPAGDTCPRKYNGYYGDVETDADIEEQLTIAPDAQHILVYEAPVDDTGQTALDEYTTIASSDIASVISESYGNCENYVGAAYAQAENTIFEQMALQGQSMFGAAGDSGAFGCLDTDGSRIVNLLDPPSQPWVTSVGGTSLESDNPGSNAHPPYPQNVETVLNPDNLCNTSAAEGGHTGYFWCEETGGGGGGSSQFWGMPFYQRGPGIIGKYTTYGNGATHCSLAAIGTPCRETPDISANADGFTGYAMYCTGSAATPNSLCARVPVAHGWFPVGGTSLSSPLWSAIIADRDSYQGYRTGNLNPLIYLLYNLDPRRYFHDITGVGKPQSAATSNGLFPVTPGYDLATGIGTPKMAALITGSQP
jgi:subtilase family serine protease